MSVRGPSEGDPGPSGREGSGVEGSGNAPRAAPSFAVEGVVFVMEFVMLGASREQEGRLEGQLVSGESDIELGPGWPGLDSSLAGGPDLMGPLGPMTPMFMSQGPPGPGPGRPGPNCPLGPIIPAGPICPTGPIGLFPIMGGPLGPGPMLPGGGPLGPPR